MLLYNLLIPNSTMDKKMQPSTIQLNVGGFHCLADVIPVDQLIWFLPSTKNQTKLNQKAISIMDFRPIWLGFHSSVSKFHIVTSSDALKSYQLHSRGFPYLSNCWKLSKKLKLRTFHKPPDPHYSGKTQSVVDLMHHLLVHSNLVDLVISLSMYLKIH